MACLPMIPMALLIRADRFRGASDGVSARHFIEEVAIINDMHIRGTDFAL